MNSTDDITTTTPISSPDTQDKPGEPDKQVSSTYNTNNEPAADDAQF